jgi:hypothetical protein
LLGNDANGLEYHAHGSIFVQIVYGSINCMKLTGNLQGSQF